MQKKKKLIFRVIFSSPRFQMNAKFIFEWAEIFVDKFFISFVRLFYVSLVMCAKKQTSVFINSNPIDSP